METNLNADPNLSDLIDDFNFAIDATGQIVDTPPAPAGDDDAEAAAAAAKAAEEAAAKAAAEEGLTDEEKEAAEKLAAEEAEKAAAVKAKKDTPTPAGKSDSFYTGLAKKYLEQGRWSKELAIEDEEGNQIPIEEVQDLNEETFFQIEEAIRAEEKQKLETDYISVSDLDERKKNLVEIIKSGGELTDVFQTPQQVEQYLNPFGNMDLDDEATQESVYMNALVKYNNLDQKSASALVKQAKEDFSLDEKVKKFVTDYTKQFDTYVEGKKKEVQDRVQEEKKQLAEFRKSLSAEYKEFGLKDSLAKTLTSAAVTKTEDGFEIDSVYDEKMQDPKEAAELILFLKDKEAYLELKMKETKVSEQKKTRKIVKMMPSQKAKKQVASDTDDQGRNEFDFAVAVE